MVVDGGTPVVQGETLNEVGATGNSYLPHTVYHSLRRRTLLLHHSHCRAISYITNIPF